MYKMIILYVKIKFCSKYLCFKSHLVLASLILSPSLYNIYLAYE